MRTFRWMIASAVAVALAGCGADEISSAGAGGNITINNPPAQNPDPDPGSGDPDPVLVTPAAGCPTIAAATPLLDEGTITGPTGEYRVCKLPSLINANTTLPRVAGLLYALDGRTNVGADLGPTGGTSLTLTIEAGVVIFAKTGTSWLAVNRGHKIQAVGTAERPIVFTSRDNVLGLVDDDDQGQWGGVVLMGRAPITNCRAPAATPGTNACDRDTEGSADAALYGGELPADSSGTLSYVQIRYSGYVLGANSELQSLTLEGVGSGTTINHIQMHNSSDDGFENFGGRANMRHIVVTGADDDSIDLDVGYKGTIQYIIAVQKTSGQADSMIELDSADAFENDSPRTHMKIANFTFVHRNPGTANQAAMLFRGAADASLVNGVVTSPISCLRLNGENILSAAGAIPDKAGPPSFASVVMTCGSPAFRVSGNNLGGTTWTNVAAAEGAFSAGANTSSTFVSTLTSGFINGANETAAVAIDPKTADAAFDTTNYVGAVRDANDTWYAGWTCNSATANFGTTSTACTSLPSLAQ
jgi:hypothetical protein